MSRRIAVLVAAALVVAACGHGERYTGPRVTTTTAPTSAFATTTAPSTSSADVSTSPTSGPASTGAPDVCTADPPRDVEVGVTADAIVVEVMADTGSPIVPGLAQGSVDAVKAWADMVNERGGLACRRVEVRTYDSKLDPNEVRNGYTEGCQDAFAMVGTFSLFVADTTTLTQCRDRAGQPVGLPEVPAVTQGVLHNCNPTSWVVFASGEPCPPREGVRAIEVPAGAADYIQSQLGAGAHGAFTLPTSTPALVESSVTIFRGLQHAGLVADVEGGSSGFDTQDHFTPFITAMKDAGSQFLFNTTVFSSFLLMRKEARAQGLDTVKLWFCQATCYDRQFLESGGADADGTRIGISWIPYEEADAVPEIATLLRWVPQPNTFSTLAWISARLFEQAVVDVVRDHGPNGLTRTNLMSALDAVSDFTANGMIGPVTPSARLPETCYVVVEATAGGFTRVAPATRGTLECGKLQEVTIDPAVEYKG